MSIDGGGSRPVARMQLPSSIEMVSSWDPRESGTESESMS